MQKHVKQHVGKFMVETFVLGYFLPHRLATRSTCFVGLHMSAKMFRNSVLFAEFFVLCLNLF